MAYHWERQSEHYARKLKMAGQHVSGVKAVIDTNCGPCFSLEGDTYIIGIFKEKYEEWKKEIPIPLPKPIDDFPLDVSLGVNVPWSDRLHNVRTIGYVPFISLPTKSSNTLYDVDKVPIEISAQVVHPDLVEYTVNYKDQNKKVIYRIGDAVMCFFSKDIEDHFRKGMFIKEDEKFLEVKPYVLKGFERDYPPVPLTNP